MKKLLFTLIYVCLLVALFYAVKATIDPQTWNNFWAYLAGDYPLVWKRHIEPNLPPLDHPVVMIILAIFVLQLVGGLMSKK